MTLFLYSCSNSRSANWLCLLLEKECFLFLIEGDRGQIILAENRSKLYISRLRRMCAFPPFGVGFFLKPYSPLYTHLGGFLFLYEKPLHCLLVPGGIAIYGLYRHVPLWRVRFSSSLLWDRVYKSESLGLEEYGIIFQETEQLVKDFSLD